MSGNILSWTVCVESSCFLTPVGGSLPLPVLLCFCSPSVSVVVSWRLYSSEGWGRAEKKKKRERGAFTSWPLWWHSNSAAVLNVGKAVYAGDHNLRSSVPGMNHRSLQHMSTPAMCKPLWICSRSRKQFFSFLFIIFLSACLKFGKLSVTLKWHPVI